MGKDIPTLQTGKYTIEVDDKGTHIFTLDDAGDGQWLATTTDPHTGTAIVEGLILVEMKRFYHPDSSPEFKSADERPLPPFLKKGSKALQDPL